MEWLIANKEWIFSGAGITIVSAVVFLLKKGAKDHAQNIGGSTSSLNIQTGDNSVISVPSNLYAASNNNPYAKYNGTLIDFFDEVTEDKPLDIEIAVNEKGKVFLFYNRPLAVHLKRIEYFLQEKSLVFLSERNHRRDAGLPIGDCVTRAIRNSEKILLVRVNESLQPQNQIELPFKFYE
uniref:Uncharacterized protein n=1 Tax=Candidatus Kentrum sp. LPFa TaxID=2126335 RepID=A0A450WSW7_9GAMM|nr:MAG: hypothetical protein BECKLPF1236B_GA0070989_12009 [Candidatus Kentron sp. LPFa]